MSDTKKYEVTRKHCLHYKIGEVVNLTDKQARSLVNKIKPSAVKAKEQVKKSEPKKVKSKDGGKDV